MDEIKIYIVDDHPVVSQGIELLIKGEPDLKLCGTAMDAEKALPEIERLMPEIVIVDISLDGAINSIDLVRSLHKLYPEMLLLVLSMHDESMYAERAIRAGARGYIMKSVMTSIIVEAIRKVIAGEIVLSQKMATRILDRLLFNKKKVTEESMQGLSGREFEVFSKLGAGLKAVDIAGEMGISIKTVETYLHRIRRKLQIENRSELIRLAIKSFKDNDMIT